MRAGLQGHASHRGGSQGRVALVHVEDRAGRWRGAFTHCLLSGLTELYRVDKVWIRCLYFLPHPAGVFTLLKAPMLVTSVNVVKDYLLVGDVHQVWMCL